MDDAVDDEVARIARVLRAARSPVPNGATGPGDDCAVLPWSSDNDLVMTTDTVAEGVQFWTESDPGDVGRFVAAVNLSDLAAAGADPRAFLLAVAMPRETDDAWLEGMAVGVGEMLRAHDVPLLGGDTKEAASRVLTGTALGSVPQGTALGRSGAKPGDVLAVSGPLGGPGAWLAALDEGVADVTQVSSVVLDARPRLAHGRLLRALGATAMTDLSDGLARGAALLAEASAVKVIIDPARIPLAPPVVERFGDRADPDDTAWRRIVVGTGGEYELLAAVPADRFDDIRSRLAAEGLPLVAVGAVSAGTGVFLRTEGRESPLLESGWRHFTPAASPY